MPIQGFIRNRKHQFARQAAFGTVAAATRAYAVKGTPAVDLKWTDPEVDTGSIDPAVDPVREAPDLSASLSHPSLHYNDIPLLMCAIFGGAVPTGTGTAQTWTHKPDPASPEDADVFTYEFGDDVTDDWYQFGDAYLDSVEVTGPDGLGPLTASGSWKFGSVASTGSTDQPVTGTVPTPGLSVDQGEAIVYLKDLAVYLSDTVTGLAAGQLSDTVHSLALRINQAWDEKRWANGDQSFDVDALGRGARGIELELTCSKNANTVGLDSLSDDWLAEGVHNAYLRFKATSKVLAETAIPYSWQVTLPARVYTRTDGEIGGNSTVVLTAHAYYEPTTFAGVIESIAVTTLGEDDLGEVGS